VNEEKLIQAEKVREQKI